MGPTKAPTKAEAERMAKIVQIGCILCNADPPGTSGTPEVHHLLDCGQRRGHAFTICLCSWHHRGVPPDGMKKKEATEKFGPSLDQGTKLFKARFGKDDELLEYQNHLLKERMP